MMTKKIGMGLALLCLYGCSDDEQFACIPPSIISDFCGASQGLGECDCTSEPIDIVAFVDHATIPNVLLVESPALYGDNNHQIELACRTSQVVVPDSLLEVLGPTDLLRASVRDARIVKVYLPDKSSGFMSYHLEVDSPDQIEFEFIESL